MSLLAIAVGIKQKEIVDRIVRKVIVSTFLVYDLSLENYISISVLNICYLIVVSIE